MAKLLVQGGHLVDPGNGRNEVADLLFEDGTVAAVGPELDVPRGAQMVDARGLLVIPGLVDTHTHVGRRTGPATR
jgi:predicted amidohydrolase